MLFPASEMPNLKKAALTIRALNHPLRQKIMAYLYEKRKSNVTDLYIFLRVEQSLTSQHLAILRRAGLVNTEKVGKTIEYSPRPEKISRLCQLSHQITENIVQ